MTHTYRHTNYYIRNGGSSTIYAYLSGKYSNSSKEFVSVLILAEQQTAAGGV